MQLRSIALIALISNSAACAKAETSASGEVYSECLAINLPVDTQLRVVGVYEGGDKLEASGDEFDDQAPGRVSLQAKNSDPPQLYVVTAYDPVIWDFKAIRGHQIRGVIVYGYYKQTAINLPKAVPVAYGTFLDEGGTKRPGTRRACGGPHNVYKGGPELDLMAEQLKLATNLKVASFNGAYSPKSMSFDETAASPAKLPSKSADMRNTDWWAKGPITQKLAALVSNGSIRLAQSDDIDGWNKMATNRLATGKLAAYTAEHLLLGRSYVVLRDFTVPEGMKGSDSRNFIIPRGMTVPKGAANHNSYYLMSDGKCVGPSPDCEDPRLELEN